MARQKDIEVTVNGRTFAKRVPVRLSLADFLREHLHLTGTHLGCEHGVCGACTVSVDGQSVRSCLMLAVQADETEVVTIEGLRDEGGLTDTNLCCGSTEVTLIVNGEQILQLPQARHRFLLVFQLDTP